MGLPLAITHATGPRPLRTPPHLWLVSRHRRVCTVLANSRFVPDTRRRVWLLIPSLVDLETVAVETAITRPGSTRGSGLAVKRPQKNHKCCGAALVRAAHLAQASGVADLAPTKKEQAASIGEWIYEP